jgi:hypothetical protein
LNQPGRRTIRQPRAHVEHQRIAQVEIFGVFQIHHQQRHSGREQGRKVGVGGDAQHAFEPDVGAHDGIREEHQHQGHDQHSQERAEGRASVGRIPCDLPADGDRLLDLLRSHVLALRALFEGLADQLFPAHAPVVGDHEDGGDDGDQDHGNPPARAADDIGEGFFGGEKNTENARDFAHAGRFGGGLRHGRWRRGLGLRGHGGSV